MKIITADVSLYRCDGCDKREESSEPIPEGWVWATSSNPHCAPGHYCTECYASMREEMLNPKPRRTLVAWFKALWSGRK